MRRRWTVVTVILAAVLVVVGTLALVSFTRRDRTAAPAPTASASPVPADTPTGTGGGGPSTGPSAMPTPPTPPAPTRGPGVPVGLLSKDIEVIPTSQRVVALTFDAGANADAVASILNTLSARQVTATFFLTGNFATTFPASVRAIAAAGHRIGNHTATHPHPLTLSDTELRSQLRVAENQLRAAGATDPRPLFRFPYGERDARTIAAVNAAGYVAVRWTVDSLGWQGLNGRTPSQATQLVIDRVLDAARPGEIVLMHVGSHPDDHTTLDAAALPTIIERLRASGYRFVTLDVLLS